MKTYDLICMSFDGCYTTDSKHGTIEEAEEASANMGSKWYFYPFHFILSGQRVIGTGEGLIRMYDKKAYMELMFKGRQLKTVIKTFKEAFDSCRDEEADCYEFENCMIETHRNLIRD